MSNGHNRAAAQFMAAFWAGQPPDYSLVEELADRALAGDAASLATLYGGIVEPLCDDFSAAGVAVANQVLLNILATLRRHALGRELDGWLAAAGYNREQQFLTRYRRLMGQRTVPRAPDKIVVLSRVSIGADVAVTSIILQRLRRQWPQSDIVMVGPAHCRELFALLPDTFFLPLSYDRFGGIWERVARSALAVREALATVAAGHAADRILLVDPDSRLSQLGLLPFCAVGQTRYFNSRSLGPTAPHTTLVERTNGWLDTFCTATAACYPALFPASRLLEQAAGFMARMRAHGSRIVVVNYGIGHNPRKRLGHDFELAILLRLLERPRTVVVLDSGSSPRGRQRVGELLAQVAATGVRCDQVSQDKLAAATPWAIPHGVVGFQGSIGAIAALIAHADGFIGYDSCCQHLANATSTPGVVVFVGAPNPRFLASWRPQNSKNTVALVEVRQREFNLQDRANLVEEVATTLWRQIAA